MADKKIPGWDKIVSKVAKQLYQGKLNGGLSDEMITHHANYLWDAVHTNFTDKALGLIDEGQMKLLRDNIFYFSGFKNLQQMKECTQLLRGKDGQVRSFSDFKKDVLAIDKTYNTFYLQSEYEFATNASQSISLWHTAQAEKDTLPYLRWSAVHDARTRPEHMELDGICLPVDHPFWRTHWVPYDWNCRCLITQETADARVTPDHHLEGLRDPRAYFRYNPGADNVIFPVDKDRFSAVHPYAANTTAAEYSKVIETVDELPEMKETKTLTKPYKVTADDIDQLKEMGVSIRGVSDSEEAAAVINKRLKGFNLLEMIKEIDSAFDGTEFEGWDYQTIRINETGINAMTLDFKGIDETTELQRLFKVEGKEKWVYHSYFELASDLQNQGISKEVFTALYRQYRAMKLDKIEVEAALSGGGYTWAKYGFCAKSKYDVDAIISKAKSTLKLDVWQDVRSIYNNYYKAHPDGREFPMWKLAKIPEMKSIMRGTHWSGILNLKNSRNRNIFEEYIKWQK